MRRAAVLVLLAGVTLVATAVPAAAHAALTGSDPDDGARLVEAPQRVSLTFNLPVQRGFSTVTVTGPGGTVWEQGEPQVQGSTVSVGLRQLGPAGQYTVAYRVLSADGHPVSGATTFTLTRDAGGAPGPPRSEDGAEAGGDNSQPARAGAEGEEADSGMPVWPWFVGAVVLVGLGAVAAMRLGRE